MPHSDIARTPSRLRAEVLRSRFLGPVLKDACAGPILLVAGNSHTRVPGHDRNARSPFQMSIAPPGYPTDETDRGSGNRQAEATVQHEFKSVQALRGREGSARAKCQSQGWEFLTETRGSLRTELKFRRVKPKTAGA